MLNTANPAKLRVSLCSGTRHPNWPPGDASPRIPITVSQACGLPLLRNMRSNEMQTTTRLLPRPSNRLRSGMSRNLCMRRFRHRKPLTTTAPQLSRTLRPLLSLPLAIQFRKSLVLHLRTDASDPPDRLIVYPDSSVEMPLRRSRWRSGTGAPHNRRESGRVVVGEV